MSDLIKAIENKLLQQPTFRQATSKLFPTNATVESFDEETELAKIRFFHPVDNSFIIAEDVPIQNFKSINAGALSRGDKVLIAFPSNIVSSPLIVSVYPEKKQPTLGGEFFPKYI